MLLRGIAALSRLASTIYIVLFFFKNENLDFNTQVIFLYLIFLLSLGSLLHEYYSVV